jgi:site-specific DNA recombinase
MIFDSYVNNRYKGINGLAHHLTEIKTPTKRGAKVWHRQVVRQILLNEAYSGVYIQNKWDTVGNYVRNNLAEKWNMGRCGPKKNGLLPISRLLSLKTIQLCSKAIRARKKATCSYGKHKYLLSGLVRCGRCGAP